MENKLTNIWAALAVVSVVLLLVCAAIWFLSQFVQSNFALAILGFAGAIATASYQYRKAKDRETKARLFSEKRRVYTDLTETLMDHFHGKKGPEQREDETELVKKLQEVRTKLIVWGSFDTIRTFDQMGDGEKMKDPTQGISWLGNLIAHMRKDLAHRDPKNSRVKTALGIVVSKDRPKLREDLKKTCTRIILKHFLSR